MKHLLLILILLFTISSQSQCPSGVTTLLNQDDVNEFGINFPNCTHITGSLHIGGGSINDLTPLTGIEQIDGDLTVGNTYHGTGLVNLNGLESLTTVGGYLSISENLSLTSLTGLNSLNFIGGDFILGKILPIIMGIHIY